MFSSNALFFTLQWRHNGRDGVSNHQPRDCLLSRLFRRKSKKTSMLRVTGLCVGNSPGPVNSPHKWPVTRKKFPFHDVIMSEVITNSLWGEPADHMSPCKLIESTDYITTRGQCRATLYTCFQRVGVVKSCFKRNLISVCTLTQSSGGTSCGLTSMKSNWNMSRSDWNCSPVHNYWLNQSKWTFSTQVTEGARYVYPRVGGWVTRREWIFSQQKKIFLLISHRFSPFKSPIPIYFALENCYTDYIFFAKFALV